MPIFDQRLIPMTDFVIEYYSNEGYADLHTLNLMNNYAKFLRMPLCLEMFVPVDEKGSILKEPKNYQIWKSLPHNREISTDETLGNKISDDNRIFQRAEAKILFEGFEFAYNGFSVARLTASYNLSIEISFNKNEQIFLNFPDIESLISLEEIYLSKSALKLIGLKTDF
ncbi:hypothetical protein [Chryseobacterium echinoideorum]|uniref:hypothetical protein n=1 Tax=Chryseobacterium echinoideorum TaxID=1549648 RepID=UPI0011872133|nr:hypothetical protein [Chryseobacterium echinoideorum]